MGALLRSLLHFLLNCSTIIIIIRSIDTETKICKESRINQKRSYTGTSRVN